MSPTVCIFKRQRGWVSTGADIGRYGSPLSGADSPPNAQLSCSSAIVSACSELASTADEWMHEFRATRTPGDARAKREAGLARGAVPSR